MKFKVSFEIDGSGTSYSIKDKNDEVSLVMQNLSMVFANLQNYTLMRKVDVLASDHPKELKDSLIEEIDEEIKVLSKMFENWKVEGTMEDGKSFIHSKNESGRYELIFQ